MKRKTNCGIRVMVAACAIAVASAWAGTASAQVAGQWKDGQHVYNKICSNCHETGVGPVIKGRNLDPDYYRHVVRHGLRAMPAFRPTDIDDHALGQVADLLSNSPAPGGAK